MYIYIHMYIYVHLCGITVCSKSFKYFQPLNGLFIICVECQTHFTPKSYLHTYMHTYVYTYVVAHTFVKNFVKGVANL